MISIILQLLSITPEHILASCARRCNAALVLIFSLVLLPPPSLLPPSLLLFLFQIDMSHCCRLTLSLESIIVSYFSCLRAVFPPFLMESGGFAELSHVWREKERKKERKGTEGERERKRF